MEEWRFVNLSINHFQPSKVIEILMWLIGHAIKLIWDNYRSERKQESTYKITDRAYKRSANLESGAELIVQIVHHESSVSITNSGNLSFDS